MKKKEKIILTFCAVTCIFAWAVILGAWTSTYDTATPASTDSPTEADDRMREIKAAVQERLAVEHHFELAGTEVSGANAGKHSDITTDSIVNAGALTTATLEATGNAAVGGDADITGAAAVGGTLDVTGNIDPTSFEATNGGFQNSDTMADASDTKVASSDSIAKYATLDADGVLMHDAEGSFNNADVNGAKTKVYTKYLTGTLNAAAAENIAHSVTDGLTKILSVTMHVYSDDASAYIIQEVRMAASATVAIQIFYNATNIVLINKGSHIVSNNYRIKIDYIL